MIGFIAGHNDVYVFFEKEKEIKELDRFGIVKGEFINKNPRIKGDLEIIIDDSINDFTKTVSSPDENFNFKEYILKIKGRLILPKLKDYGRFSDNGMRGKRTLINNKFAEFFEKSIYEQACFYREKYKKEWKDVS